LVEACQKNCRTFYEVERAELKCDEYMRNSYKTAVAPQYEDCMKSHKVSRSDAGVWCGTMCNGYGAGKPYGEHLSTDCPDVNWPKDICDNGGVADWTSTPAEFVPIENDLFQVQKAHRWRSSKQQAWCQPARHSCRLPGKMPGNQGTARDPQKGVDHVLLSVPGNFEEQRLHQEGRLR
jgi:hypothetical protein